ncbi:Alpha-(1,3)-fucosyltransferase 9 [Cichlidogyrus casuarinus]|uniref:Fucosyltransferase n=1 Tax=Cichlidogyrus casuarinus TaxID=1844966 RepID=A0ABD2Q426_9PLAT
MQINSESPAFVKQTKPFVQDVEWQSDYTNKSIAPILAGFYARYDKPECGTPLSEKEAVSKFESPEIRSHLPNGFMRKQNVAYALISNTFKGWVYSKRAEYLEEFSQHFPLHIYGRKQSRVCPENVTDCPHALSIKYKFYMSFENSKCSQYISEKFFHNALQYNVIPVVLGAPKQDYEAFAPPNSYIHVDDFPTPKDLADYLNKIATDTIALSRYFAWKQFGRIIYPSPRYFPACVAIKDAIVRNYFPISLTNAKSTEEECSLAP